MNLGRFWWIWVNPGAIVFLSTPHLRPALPGLQALQPRNLAADARAEKQLVALLSLPLESYDVVTVLGLSRYPGLMGLLQLTTRKEMAVKIVQCILKSDTKVQTLNNPKFQSLNPEHLNVYRF